MATGRPQTALRIARAAAEMDPKYRALEEDLRHRIARQHLTAADRALVAGRFTEARYEAERARTIAHDLPDAAEVIRRIDEGEAKDRAMKARKYAKAGRYDMALKLAHGAAELDSDDPEIAELFGQVDSMRRMKEFNDLLVDVQEQFNDGKLSAVGETIAKMSALRPDDPRLAEVNAKLDEREQWIAEALKQARAAREAGEYIEAKRKYDLALSLVSDRWEINDELRASMAEGGIVELRKSGRNALEAGKPEIAAEWFERALLTRADPETEKMYREAVARIHRKALYKALDEEKDRVTAMVHLKELLEVQPDETSERILIRLGVEHAEEKMVEAVKLHDEGKTDEAVDLLTETYAIVQDQRLLDLRGALRADALIKKAVSAEQAGDYGKARSLYLDALAEGGDRPGIAKRLEDIESNPELQQRYSVAQKEIDFYKEELASAQEFMAKIEDRAKRWKSEAEQWRRKYEREAE
jgi:tetratricopeptide (TPR) repeat protein